MGIKILGTGWAVPGRCVTNAELEKTVDTSDEWIRTRTGIGQRYLSDGETTSALGTRAVQDALAHAGVEAGAVDCIIAATFTCETMTPSCACLIQEHLGLSDKPVMAFDVNAACSGYIYAMNIASALLASGQVRCACIVGVETLSNVTNWEDRSTCVLFGDGAGAAVLKWDASTTSHFFTAAAGDASGILEARAFPVRTPIVMEGNKVFRFATKAMAGAVDEILKRSGLTIGDIDWIVPHQANLRIIDYVTKKSGIDPERVYVNIERFGNTSSASVAIAFAELMEKGLASQGMRIILVGFGAGFTWGAALLEI